jgi:cytochrome P450
MSVAVGERQDTTAPAVTVRASWRAMAAALGGDALAAFPREAFAEEVVIHRFFGHYQIIFNRPAAIRHVLIENAGNYRRPVPVVRVLRPIFGQGLFLSTGEEWRRQRRMVASAFAPRAVGILARNVAAAADSLIAELATREGQPIDLVPRLQRLALDVIGSAVFSLEMTRCSPHRTERGAGGAAAGAGHDSAGASAAVPPAAPRRRRPEGRGSRVSSSPARRRTTGGGTFSFSQIALIC